MSLIGTLLAIAATEGYGQTKGSATNTAGYQNELDEAGVDVPWTQKYLPLLFGFSGAKIKENIYAKKAGRVEAGQREAAGLETAEAIKDSNAAIARQIQQQINQNIATVNRQFGPTRYNSGQREKAITDVTNAGTSALANAIGGNTLQANLSLAQMAEERAWRQAQIDMTDQTDRTGTFGNIFNLLAMLMVNKPELAGNLWNYMKTGEYGQPSEWSYAGDNFDY